MSTRIASKQEALLTRWYYSAQLQVDGIDEMAKSSGCETERRWFRKTSLGAIGRLKLKNEMETQKQWR